jgi:hypothetical protein
MPAPTSIQIKNNLKTALLSNGYWYKTYDENGNLIEDKTKLMPEMDKICESLSQGIELTFIQWIPTVTVVGTATVTTAPGIAPVTGTII